MAATTLQGTDLEKTPAPDFQLNDSAGQSFRLSEQKGRVVVLTFLYTNCPDECPLIAERFRDAATGLAGDARDVLFVAVSLDPEHDTSEAVQKFLKAHRVEGTLTYLLGSRAALAPIWKQYFLSVLLGSNPNILQHQSRVVVIDRAGLQRSNFNAALSADALVNDIRIAMQ
jgi:protein SCO1/2